MNFSAALIFSLAIPLAANAALQEPLAYSALRDDNHPDSTGHYLDQTGGFGLNVLPTGAASANIGRDLSGASFISLTANTALTSASLPYSEGKLDYRWQVLGNSSEAVLIHISTEGFIAYDYGFTPYLKDTYSLGPNHVYSYVQVVFRTNLTDNVYDTRTYGLATFVAPGITFVAEDPGNFSSQNGGTSHIYAHFKESFNLWVQPNMINFIDMDARNTLSNDQSTQELSSEHYSFSNFIDPLITIDAAFADRFSLETSVIPFSATTAAVPEPETYVLMLAGLVCIAAVSRRRKQCSHSLGCPSGV